MTMKCITLAAAGAAAIFANVAVVDAATRLSQSECTKLWQQANPSNAKGLTESQSAPYIANFKAVNLDGDTSIDLNEWNAACKKGLVKSTSSSGASSGDTGAAPKATEHAPKQE
jgi:hypothetical protein